MADNILGTFHVVYMNLPFSLLADMDNPTYDNERPQ